MFSSLKLIRDIWRVRAGHCERIARPGRWVVYKTDRGIAIEVFNVRPTS